MTPHKDAVLRRRRPIRIARHEAAHAVLAEMCGHTVVEAVIQSSEGHVKHHCRGRKPDPLSLGIIVAGGHASEVLWHGASRMKAPKDDHEFLVKMGFQKRSLPTLLNIAMAALNQVQPMVFAVATELQKRDLTGKEIRTIINACEDPQARAAFVGH